MMKRRIMKKLGGLMILTTIINGMCAATTVSAAEEQIDQDYQFQSAIEHALQEGSAGTVVRSRTFSEKEDVYALLEQTCRNVDTPELFLEKQCYASYHMVTLAGQAGYYLTAEIARYDKVNDLDAEEIVHDLGLDGCSDMEIAIKVHEWLTDELSYGPSKESLAECLEYGVGKCDDYSMIYASVMNAAGVETRCMDGIPINTKSGHMWNMVCMDGAWYLCDVTNDDLDGSYAYFMKSVFSSDVRAYLGDYLDGYRLCNGIDEFLSYELADRDYFNRQVSTTARTINLAKTLGISVSSGMRVSVDVVSFGGGSVKRTGKSNQKIVLQGAVDVIYGTYQKNHKKYYYLIQCR